MGNPKLEQTTQKLKGLSGSEVYPVIVMLAWMAVALLCQRPVEEIAPASRQAFKRTFHQGTIPREKFRKPHDAGAAA